MSNYINYIDISDGKYIDVTELGEMIDNNEYDIICEQNFPCSSYGMTTDDFIDLINDCKRVNLGKAVSKRTPKKVVSSKKHCLINFVLVVIRTLLGLVLVGNIITVLIVARG